MSNRNSKNKIQYNRGVTFMELIMVMTIFAIMSGVVLFRYRDFDAGVSLTNTVQEIALRVQKAQSDAVNGVQPKLASINQTPPGNTNWRNTYGVLFSKSHPKDFIYFFDRETSSISNGFGLVIPSLNDLNPWSGSCGNASDDECLDLITINTGEEITDVCVETATATPACGLDEAWVAFSRPFPDAKIYYKDSGGQFIQGTALRVTVIGKNDSVGTRILTVNPLGQINVSRGQ